MAISGNETGTSHGDLVCSCAIVDEHMLSWLTHICSQNISYKPLPFPERRNVGKSRFAFSVGSIIIPAVATMTAKQRIKAVCGKAAAVEFISKRNSIYL